jgi:murein DD-endopeptidase MepM/ murein hydrolase activator NlpD
VAKQSDGNPQSSEIGSNVLKKPKDAIKTGISIFKGAKAAMKAAKFIAAFIKKLVASIIKVIMSFIAPYFFLILTIIILLLLVLDSLWFFDFNQKGSQRTEAAVIFDDSVKVAMENQLTFNADSITSTISNTQSTSPYPMISQAWLNNASKVMKGSLAIPTIHHYFKNLKGKNYKAWHEKYEDDNASNPEELKKKYVELIEKELAYYFTHSSITPSFTYGTPPIEEYTQTTSTTSCVLTDEEGNVTNTNSGPTVSKTVHSKRDIVTEVKSGYLTGLISYKEDVDTTSTVSTSSSDNETCTTTVFTEIKLYILDESAPIMVDFNAQELVELLVLSAPEGDRTKLVPIQDLDYALEMAKSLDPLFPSLDMDLDNLIACSKTKNADVKQCIATYVQGGSYNSALVAGSGGWYPSEYEAFYKTYADKAGIDWFILAAVHGQETTFSINPVASDPSKGSYNAKGELVGAVGHFQFMSATWVGWAASRDYPMTAQGRIIGDISFIKSPSNIKKYGGLGKDANNDGVADPWHIEDSMYAAAMYLKQLGYVKNDEAAIKKALALYNGGYSYFTSPAAQNYASQVYSNGKRFESGIQDTANTMISVLPGKLTHPTVGRYTSGYGYRTLNGTTKMHYGIDIANAVGTQVVSVADGTIVKVSGAGEWGNHIKVQHNVDGQAFQTLYAHLDAVKVSVGQVVKKGQLIGLMGNTGHSFGSHLHLEVYLPPYTYKTSNINPSSLIPKAPTN